MQNFDTAIDGWWAATIAAVDRFRPVATVNFSANLLDHASVPADEFLLHHGFATDGRLAVDNLQSIVLIK